MAVDVLEMYTIGLRESAFIIESYHQLMLRTYKELSENPHAGAYVRWEHDSENGNDYQAFLMDN